MWGNHSRIIHSPRVVMMCEEKKYNPQGGSLLACIITQGRLRCTCQPCAIESITPMGYGHTACGWRKLSNVQCDEVMAHRVVWWGLVGAVGFVGVDCVQTVFRLWVVSKKVCKLTIILIFALSNKKQQEYGTYTRTNFGNYFELHK